MRDNSHLGIQVFVNLRSLGETLEPISTNMASRKKPTLRRKVAFTCVIPVQAIQFAELTLAGLNLQTYDSHELEKYRFVSGIVADSRQPH